MVKNVEYKGKNYKIDFVEYGYSGSRFVVNDEQASTYILNCNINNIEEFKITAERAIIEYIERHKSHEKFEQWDGKL